MGLRPETCVRVLDASVPAKLRRVVRHAGSIPHKNVATSAQTSE
jgi:hypothetical protein